MTSVEATRLKDEAHRLVDNLDDDATWDDLMYAIYLRLKIEAGLADAEAGRLTPHEDVRRRFGLA
ncbi:MAG: hypothetical protein ACKVT1_13810 [Dehalococcoidia bacterium]